MTDSGQSRMLLGQVLHLWRRRWVVLLVAVAGGVAMALATEDSRGLAFGLFVLLATSLSRPLAFGLRTARYWRFAAEDLTIYFAPALAGGLDLAAQARAWADARAALQALFGFPLRHRLVVYYFPNSPALGRLFGQHLRGWAAYGADMAVVAADAMRESGERDEIIRHELAHLLSARCGDPDPPLKAEGIATWCQQTWDGKAVDCRALSILATASPVALRRRLRNSAFFKRSAESYLLAGSFTGYLLRHWGWDSYRRFFRTATGRRFRGAFRRVFGLDLDEAERRWRLDLSARRAAFEPDVTRAEAEAQVARALFEGDFRRVVVQATPLLQNEETGPVALTAIGVAELMLDEFASAAAHLEQALALCAPALHSRRAAQWVRLG